MEIIKKCRFYLYLITLSLTGYLNTIGAGPVIFSSGQAAISFKDHLHHEFYWWPNTLFTYPIVFNETVSAGELVLTDKKSGKQVPFQLTGWEKTKDGKTKAVLNLVTDLPSGGGFEFVLKKGTPENFPKIKVEQKSGEINVQTDKLTVYLPASQAGTGSIPGPVLGISQNGKSRMGSSAFQSGAKKLKQLESRVTSEGPLFVDVEMNYTFTDGSTYLATVRCVNGYEFVELKEKMEGFEDGQTGWEMTWENFSPTHRQAPNHPYGGPKNSPGFQRYDWEKIDQSMLNSHHGITYAGSDGRIPFEIGIYGNWPAERTVTSSVFWDEKAMLSVGIFMEDASYWDDREYSIWSNTGKINVKFFYNNGKLRWVYPVSSGQRSTAISCYPHQKNIEYMEELERLSSPQKSYPRTRISQLSYNTFLQNRYSTIALNRLKDWDLTYPSPKPLAPVIFKKQAGSVSDLERRFLQGGYSNELAISGPCQNSGYAPVPARSFYSSYVGDFNVLLPQATEEQRGRLAAMFLLHAYIAAGEEYMPMRGMLSGHPNFLADVKPTAGLAAFLFPEHPEAKNWGEMFEKYVDLNTRYHVRPDVESWDSKGGRWTENLGTYVWAYLNPSLRANYLLKNYFKGTNHFANSNNMRVGSWLLNSLSAPYDGESLDFYRDGENRLGQHYWGIVTKEMDPRRVHPPQGAHAARRMPSSSLWLLGQELKNYAPLLSENISFVSRPDDQEMEKLDRSRDPFAIMYPEKGSDPGTPPDFQSVKLTGYGIILRSAVGTKDELSVHLQQIDRGPNYRWGLAADGGCGTIYFFANGKAYSHNGREDIGDRRIQDTDLITNFGVFKEGRFKAIGQGELSRPMYNFSSGQFAEIVSSQSSGYSWPEYQGRSIMLVGSDYFLIYDDVYNQNMSTRFSWFTHPEEELPEINIVRGGGARYNYTRGKPEFITHSGSESKGIWLDGGGDCMAFVSHKKEFTQETTDYGCIVTSPQGQKDYIFRNDTPIKAQAQGFVFEGTAGFIRQKDSKIQEMALFHGSKIGNESFEIQISDPDAGIAALYSGIDKINGEYSSPVESAVTFLWTGTMPEGIAFYLNGVKLQAKQEKNKLLVNMPKGKHIWTLTKGLPGVPRPTIASTRNAKGKVLVAASPAPGAGSYRFEYSTDGTTGWKNLKQQNFPELIVSPAGSEKKGYVRIISLNADNQSQPSIVYPLYYTNEKPHYPDGLKLSINDRKTDLSWGQVLGCNEYKLYRRTKGSGKSQLVYKGNLNTFTDATKSEEIVEYAVAAVNGNGDSSLSAWVDNDPDSWLNFDPMPGESFRRNRWSGAGNPGEELYYPE